MRERDTWSQASAIVRLHSGCCRFGARVWEGMWVCGHLGLPVIDTTCYSSVQVGSIPANAADDGQWSQGLISAVSHLLLPFLLWTFLEGGLDPGSPLC